MNMKIFRPIVLVLIFVLSAFMIVSCGKDTPEDADPTDGTGITETVASTEEATDPTEETGELVFDISAFEDPTEAMTDPDETDDGDWIEEEEETSKPTDPPKTQQPGSTGSTQSTQPSNGSSTQPSQPSNGGSTQPSQPSNGGSTQPTQPSNGGSTQPTEPPTQPPTEAPTEPGNSGTQESESVTYEDYMAMSAAEQQSFINSFESVDAFFAWFNAAKAEHDAKDNSIDIGDGNIDLGGGNN